MIRTDLAEFIESGISVLVGTCDARRRPDCVRGAGVTVEARRGVATVFLPDATGAQALANLRDTGRIAVNVTRAIDHRSLQLKGSVIEIREATEEERQGIAVYLEKLSLDWGFVGVPRKTTLAMNHWPASAVRFRVEALFEQTPGPGAGEPLGARGESQSRARATR